MKLKSVPATTPEGIVYEKAYKEAVQQKLSVRESFKYARKAYNDFVIEQGLDTKGVRLFDVENGGCLPRALGSGKRD